MDEGLLLMGVYDEDDITNVLPSQLNEKQQLASKIVKNASYKQQQLLMIVSGTAGTGNSLLLIAFLIFLMDALRDAHRLIKLPF